MTRTRMSVLILAALAAAAFVPALVGAACVDYEDYIHFQHAEPLPGVGSPAAITRAGFTIAVSRYGYGIDLLDGTHPYEPGYLGWAPVRSEANEAIFDSPYLYVADGDSGVTVIDITDPGAAFICGGTSEPGYAECITRTRDKLLVGTDEFLWIVDHSTPCSPIVEDGVETVDFVMDVTTGLEDEYAFLACFEGGVQIIDIDAQTVEATIPTTGEINCICVAGTYLYACFEHSNDESLLVYNVATPSSPQRVASLELNRPALDISYAYQRLWIANDRGIDVVSVASGYENPALVDFVKTYAKAASCVPTTDLLLAATYDSWSEDDWVGVEFIALGSKEMVEPEDLIVIDTPIDMTASGPYGYVTTIDGDFYTLDLLSNTTPYSEYVESWITGITLGDLETAYVCSDAGNLYRVDVSDPTDPEVVASGDGYSYPWSVATSDVRAYTAPGGSFVCIFDITQPDTLQLVCVNDAPGKINAVEVRGDYLYGVGLDGVQSNCGLHVFDVSDPDTAVAVGKWGDARCDQFYALALDGDQVYACGHGGFSIVDVSNPANPTTVGHVRVPGENRGVSVGEGYAYIAGYNGGYLVIDLADPSDPNVVGQFCGPSYSIGTRDAFAYGEYVYVLDENEGVHVFGRHCDDTTDIPEHDGEVVAPSKLHCSPNPFGRDTELSFAMPSEGHARLAIYDVAGRQVATLVDGVCGAGPVAVEWDGRSASGAEVAAGVYFAKLDAAGEKALAKVVVLR